jgi:hypothetical protein
MAEGKDQRLLLLLQPLPHLLDSGPNRKAKTTTIPTTRRESL